MITTKRMMKALVVSQVSMLVLAEQTTIPPGLEDKLAATLQGAKSGQQSLPCTLFEQVVDYEDGTDGSQWVCQVYGIDAKNAGTTFVPIEGIEHVLKAKPDIHSGHTTLFANGARFTKDNVFDHGRSKHKLFISSDNDLTFGEADSARRSLAAATGDLSVLVARVSTPDTSMGKSVAEISGDVFGTGGSGDTINLKSNAEGCSKNVVTINPASGSGTRCLDDQDAIFNVPRNDPGLIYNCDFFNYWQFSTPGDLCPYYGDSTQVDDPNETANTRCCICGGGDTVPYEIVDGVLDLELFINTVGTDKSELESKAVKALNGIFAVSDLAEKFDLVMICLPWGSYATSETNPPTTDWIAYAYVGGAVSVYNGDRWCANEVTQFHEVGHSWGLRHASEGYQEYGDLTGAMGSTGGYADDTPFGNRMCFNGAHSWQLGWYTFYNLEINPLTTNFVGTLVGVDRVPNVLPGQNIVLKLSNSVEDYYVIYNHAIGVNDGSIEARNRVTITKKATGDVQTFLVSNLAEGSHVTFPNWAGTADSVSILVTSITTDANTGNANVEVWKGEIGDRPAPAAPTTPSPTNGPTSGPTDIPTVAPPPTPHPTTPPPTPQPITPPPTPQPTKGEKTKPGGGGGGGGKPNKRMIRGR